MINKPVMGGTTPVTPPRYRMQFKRQISWLRQARGPAYINRSTLHIVLILISIHSSLIFILHLFSMSPIAYIVSSSGINEFLAAFFYVITCSFSFFSISHYSMKQIAKEEEKPFTSSLNIGPEACCRYVHPTPLKPPPYFLADL